MANAGSHAGDVDSPKSPSLSSCFVGFFNPNHRIIFILDSASEFSLLYCFDFNVSYNISPQLLYCFGMHVW